MLWIKGLDKHQPLQYISPFICAEIAQSVEQRTENPRVRSSNLRLGTMFKGVSAFSLEPFFVSGRSLVVVQKNTVRQAISPSIRCFPLLNRSVVSSESSFFTLSILSWKHADTGEINRIGQIYLTKREYNA